mmetsp:Transcript_25195/g.54838  ORF Transcript_25195/g.54838 Transcript_25195/m.54838 type:complete len:95 (+) Transcript_25195:1-285(+)
MPSGHHGSGEAMLQKLGLTDADRASYVDLGPYMNIAPLSVQEECSVWKAHLYFRTMGLRHLPVVDIYNCVRGIITRKDFMALIEEEEERDEENP